VAERSTREDSGRAAEDDALKPSGGRARGESGPAFGGIGSELTTLAIIRPSTRIRVRVVVMMSARQWSARGLDRSMSRALELLATRSPQKTTR
jgi:hypothetical protein